MAQYTFSFARSEYDRIPLQLKAELEKALGESKADEETKALIAAVCASVQKSVADICRYSQDQLHVW